MGGAVLVRVGTPRGWGADMAVLCEAISVLVPTSALQRSFPGGVAGYVRTVPNTTYCSDEVLTRVGFMHPNDVRQWISHLEGHGLVFVTDRDGQPPRAVDFVVVDQRRGPTCECSWLDTEVISGVRWGWWNALPRGRGAAPAHWQPSDTNRLTWHSDEEAEGMVFATTTRGDQSINPQTGATEYVSRPFQDVQLRDEAVRAARRDYELSDYRAAHRHIHRAEHHQPLTTADAYLAALICYQLGSSDAAAARRYAPEAAHRWQAVTNTPQGRHDPQAWFIRGRVEGWQGHWDTSTWCLEQSLRLRPNDPCTLAELAFVSAVVHDWTACDRRVRQACTALGQATDAQPAMRYLQQVFAWIDRERARVTP